MSDQLQNTTERAAPEISRRAISIARLIDRLDPGQYSIRLSMPPSGDWGVEVVQSVTVQKKMLPPSADLKS